MNKNLYLKVLIFPVIFVILFSGCSKTENDLNMYPKQELELVLSEYSNYGFDGAILLNIFNKTSDVVVFDTDNWVNISMYDQETSNWIPVDLKEPVINSYKNKYWSIIPEIDDYKPQSISPNIDSNFESIKLRIRIHGYLYYEDIYNFSPEKISNHEVFGEIELTVDQIE